MNSNGNNSTTLADTFGTQFIDTIVHGAELEVSFTMTLSSYTDIDTVALAFTLKILFVKIRFNLEFGSEDFGSSYGIDFEVIKIIGGPPNSSLPPEPTFKDAVEYINNFNNNYEQLYRNYDASNNNTLDKIEPVGFMLSSTNDVLDAMEEEGIAIFDKKMDGLGKVFQHISYWQAKLERVRSDVEDLYKKDPKLLKEMYHPYVTQWQKVMDKLDEKMNECANFGALLYSEIIKTTTKVSELYPKVGTPDDDLIRGLIGEYYLPDLVHFGDYEPLKDTYYIGYAIRDEETVVTRKKNEALDEGSPQTYP